MTQNSEHYPRVIKSFNSSSLNITTSRSFNTLVLIGLAMAVLVDIAWLLLILSYLSILVVHELGHAWMAARCGVKGRGIELRVLHGCFYYDPPETAFEDAMIAWGGVMAQAMIFVPAIALFHLFADALPGAVNLALLVLGYLNLMMAIFNLTPVAPLDGSKCWRAIPLHLRYSRGAAVKPVGKAKGRSVVPFRRS